MLNHTPNHNHNHNQSIPNHHPHASQVHFNSQTSPPNLHTSSDPGWKSLIEQRLSTFDNKIDSLVELLKINQQVMMNNQLQFMQQQQQQQQHYAHESVYSTVNGHSISYPYSRSYSPESRPDSHESISEYVKPKRPGESEPPSKTKKRKSNNDASPYLFDFVMVS